MPPVEVYRFKEELTLEEARKPVLKLLQDLGLPSVKPEELQGSLRSFVNIARYWEFHENEHGYNIGVETTTPTIKFFRVFRLADRPTPTGTPRFGSESEVKAHLLTLCQKFGLPKDCTIKSLRLAKPPEVGDDPRVPRFYVASVVDNKGVFLASFECDELSGQLISFTRRRSPVRATEPA